MKKLAIVALALVLAMAFVGCNLGTEAMLKGDWYEEYTWQGVEYRADWSFQDDNVLKFNEYVKGSVNDPAEAVWLINESGILEITATENVTKVRGIIGTWNVDLSEKDKLTLTRVVEDPVKNNKIVLSRVTDAK